MSYYILKRKNSFFSKLIIKTLVYIFCKLFIYNNFKLLINKSKYKLYESEWNFNLDIKSGKSGECSKFNLNEKANKKKTKKGKPNNESSLIENVKLRKY